MEQESTTGPGSLLSLCNQHPFESQQQSHNTAFFGMTRVCLFVFQQGTRDRKKKHTLTHHLQACKLAGGQTEEKGPQF